MTNDYDLIVLGLGPGGELVAGKAAEAGQSVLGVDSGLVGGECPYYGCVPSKMMIRGSDVLAEARRVNQIAGHAIVTPDFAPVHGRIRDEATDNWDDEVAVKRFTDAGGTFVRGTGRLAGRDPGGRLVVTADGQTYTAAKVVLAVGTAPLVPPIEGLAELRAAGDAVWTNREVVKTETVPASLVVLGGGAIGVELAQVFSRFGARVTVLEAAPRLIALEEPEASEVLTDVLTKEGLDVRTGVKAIKVAGGGDGVLVTLDTGDTVTGEKLLVAAGRRSNLADLALETVGLDPAAHTVEVDEHLRVVLDGAPVEGLHAVGDVTGRGAFTHVSVWQATILAAHLTGEAEHFGGYHGLAWATFTDPEVGRVGLTEQQARDRGLSVKTGAASMPRSARGWMHGPGNDGVIKLVEDTDRGVLVGATVVSPYGGEILGLLTLAVHAEVPVATLSTMHYAYPTLHRAVLDAVNDLQSP